MQLPIIRSYVKFAGMRRHADLSRGTGQTLTLFVARLAEFALGHSTSLVGTLVVIRVQICVSRQFRERHPAVYVVFSACCDLLLLAHRDVSVFKIRSLLVQHSARRDILIELDAEDR